MISTDASQAATGKETEVIPAQPAGRGRQLRSALLIAVLSAASYLLISHFVLMSVQVKGASMSPTLLDGDRYVLFRCPYLWRSPKSGEIVVIRDPEDHGLSVKRVIGVPNDVVEVRRDGVYVNNVKLTEPYLTSLANLASGDMPVKPTHLGDDSFFVMGDNRSRSADSRSYGPVPRKNILGLIAKGG